MEFLYILLGLLLGAVGVYFWAQKTLSAQSASLEYLNAENQECKKVIAHKESEVLRLHGDLATQKAQSDYLRIEMAKNQEEIQQTQQKMQEQFSSIAHKILVDNAHILQQQHKERLEDVLSPLKEKIQGFETKVEQAHKENIRDNQSLKEQLLHLQKLNQNIGEEAKNLTLALKGQNKTQGNWGEFVLESVLEKSGLVKGREYHTQASFQSEEGRRQQPDVIIHLPEGKHLIIDAKLSLIAYERYCSAESEDDRKKFLREHIRSLQQHVKGLSEKNYQQLYELKSLDFVLMFIPVEPAFNLAIQEEHSLYTEALEKNIILVSASTLLATLRTISHLWRQEYQNQNAQEIARQGGDLYDKFVSFLEDLLKVGTKINEVQGTYSEAMKKLYEGKGNLIKRAENIKKLGAKTAKTMDARLLERASAQDEN
jgi:DNA recombination protein RmuC